MSNPAKTAPDQVSATAKTAPDQVSATAKTAKSSIESSKNEAQSIEKQLSELDSAVEWFYGDDFSLDEALDKYKTAAELAEKIEKNLTSLKNEVEVIADFTKS